MSETLLTVQQAARRLHIHPTTARRHLRNGSLRGIKRGNLWRVPESALLETPSTAPSRIVSSLAHALELIKTWDAELGDIKPDSSSVEDLRRVRQ